MRCALVLVAHIKANRKENMIINSLIGVKGCKLSFSSSKSTEN
jgi:hypothetical protein